MVDLVALPQAAQDRDRLLDRRFDHQDRLEPTFERRVLLDVLPVLLDGRRPDAVEGAAGEGRLQQIRGVQGPAFRGPGVDQRVDLVDEQDDRPLRSLDLLDDRLEPLLELAPELGAGQEGPEVQGDDPLVPERLGHILLGDPQREPFHDRRLADPGIPDQDRVVLRAAGEDLQDPANLLAPADDRVELARPGQFGQVPTILLQGPVLRFLRPAGHRAVAAADLLEPAFKLALADPGGVEELPGRGGDREQAEQKLVDGRVAVLAAVRLRLGRLDDLRERPGQVLVGRRDVIGGRPAPEPPVELLPEPARVRPEPLEERGDRTVPLGQEAGQKVLRFDRRVPSLAGDLEGAFQGDPRRIGQPLEVHGPLLSERADLRTAPVPRSWPT